ncbi:MAG: GGDEF domain-containing protein [Gammaproteobacteria bacterium]|nr:GGDEF domain-containing protein [Gammaproteobacteria bacterium]
MPLLDTQTLIIITVITLILTAGAILLTWMINRKMPGANHWALGYLLIATGVLLQGTQEFLHPIISKGFANHSFAAGFYLLWMGTRIFQNKEALSLRYFIVMHLMLLMMLVLLGLDSSGLVERTILMSLLLGSISFLISFDLLRDRSDNNFSHTVIGIIFALLTIAFIARGFGAGMMPESGTMVSAGRHSHITYLFAIIFNIVVAFGFVIMLTERLENRLRHLADTDYLTGLNSRRAVVKTAERLISRGNKSNKPTSLVMLDLDNFKVINDTYGHPAGDELLRHFGRMMRDCFRPDDLIGRMGGEEFVAVLAETKLSDAFEAAERLRATFGNKPVLVHGQDINATVSIGISTTESGSENFSQLFNRADKELYQAKQSGRNRISSKLRDDDLEIQEPLA